MRKHIHIIFQKHYHHLISNANISINMHASYGICPIGLKRRLTYEQLIKHQQLHIVKYPDRTATCLRNSPLMAQFDYMGMFEPEEEQRRDMIERQQEDTFESNRY